MPPTPLSRGGPGLRWLNQRENYDQHVERLEKSKQKRTPWQRCLKLQRRVWGIQGVLKRATWQFQTPIETVRGLFCQRPLAWVAALQPWQRCMQRRVWGIEGAPETCHVAVSNPYRNSEGLILVAPIGLGCSLVKLQRRVWGAVASGHGNGA